MFSKKEIFSILSIALVLGTLVSLNAENVEAWQTFIFTSIGTILLVILINVIAKKIMAFFFDAEIEIKTWEFQRLITINPFSKRISGLKDSQKMKSKFPAGFFIPLIVKFISVGLVNWMACLTFEIKGTVYRTARRWQMYQYSEVTEDEMGWIAFIGIIANLLFAVLGYLINMPLFSKLNLVYAFFQVIPLGDLDGTKMFFGRQSLWWAAAIIASIGLVMSMVIV
ncbi:hypothetical protein GW932_02005 [archaeon]|nr:hypothetical protein [archaeon]